VQLSKRSWMYRVAYFWTSVGCRPSQVNLCPFVRRFFFQLFFGLPIILPLVVVVFLAVVAVTAVFISLVGKRLSIRTTRESEGGKVVSRELEIVPYRLPRIRGHRVWPLSVLVVAAFLVYLPSLVNFFGDSVLGAITNPVITLTLAFVATTAFTVLCMSTWEKSKTREVFKAWRESVHARICPTIQVVD
jgi:hypothetical protein